MYANGMVPFAVLVHIVGNIWLPPGTAARFAFAFELAFGKYGVRLRFTPDRDGLGGWNGYRPKSAQVLYKNHYGWLAAAVGFSTHGGNVGGREIFAADIDNWAELGWARFAAVMRLAGLTVDYVTPREEWHVVDLNDPWTVPSWAGGTVAPTPTPMGDEAMYIRALSDGAWARKGVIYTNDVSGHWRGMTNLEGSGFVLPLVAQGKLPFAEFNGTDLDLLFAVNGVWEQQTVDSNAAPRWGAAPGVPLMGLGVMTGKVMYPGTTGWHYPITQTPPDVKLSEEDPQ